MNFSWTATTLLTSIAVMIIAAICCMISWRRSGYSRNYGLLEILRLVIVAVVLFTLNQPEVTQEFQPEDRPVLAVLHDISNSMQTRDVLNPEGSASAPTTRLDAVRPLIAPELWERAKNRVDLVTEPFSSSLAKAERGTDIHAALQRTVDQHPNLRGIVLLSDGDWNTGTAPATAASVLRMKNVPVYAVGLGSEERLPDVELTGLDAPTFGVVGKSMRIPFRIVNWLPRDRDLVVRLEGTDAAPVEKSLRVSAMGQIQETLEWKPAKIGEYSLTMKIPVDDLEAVTDNNSLTFPIAIRNEELKVLLVESYPRWEYRYLRNALERDPGVSVSCLLFHPDLESVGDGRGYLAEFPDEKQLFDYDVVFLGDVGIESRQLTAQNCAHLRQLVRSHAGGLVFLPGFRGRQMSLLTTELEELYPVIPESSQPKGVGSPRAARYALTEAGHRSLLTRLETRDEDNERVWQDLPGFHWFAATSRAKVGSEVLVTHDSEVTRYGRVPLIVTRTSGTGKVLFMGTDSAWRWRKGVEDLYHYRFWGQVVRWMAYQRNMSQGESMRLFHSPDRPEANNVLTLNANVMNVTGEPLREGTVVVQVIAPSGQTDSVRLSPASEDSWGLFTGTMIPKEGGTYRLITTCVETKAQLETDITIQGPERERIGQPARFDVLKEIAEVSRGRLVSISDVQKLVDEIAEMPDPETVTRRFRLWSHPAWAAMILGLMTLFWIGRKLAGLA